MGGLGRKIYRKKNWDVVGDIKQASKNSSAAMPSLAKILQRLVGFMNLPR
jgi:hypothetical protein